MITYNFSYMHFDIIFMNLYYQVNDVVDGIRVGNLITVGPLSKCEYDLFPFLSLETYIFGDIP